MPYHQVRLSELFCQKCRVGYLSRRIANKKIEAVQYVDRTAVAVELLKDSKERKKEELIYEVIELRYLRFLMKWSILKMLLRRRRSSK